MGHILRRISVGVRSLRADELGRPMAAAEHGCWPVCWFIRYDSFYPLDCDRYRSLAFGNTLPNDPGRT